MSSYSTVEISVVIPTRNRFAHLQQTIESIEAQTFLPQEIIIVDASDDIDFDRKNLVAQTQIQWLVSRPSVCVQRNLGIRQAKSEWVLLCDDDIELEKNYLEKLAQHLTKNKTVGAVAGLILQKEKNEWIKNYPIKSFSGLLWKFIFQYSIWGSIDSVTSPYFFKPLHRLINSFYKRRGNTQTLAGWPLITDWNGEFFRTKFYSIGATLIKKDWLIKSPYDEKLDANGIGDNYGVAMGFEGNLPIHVLTNTYVYHHRAEENRKEESKVKYLRILALDYFLTKNGITIKQKLFFIWSLLGHCLFSLLRERKYFWQLTRAFFVVVFDRNPLKN